MAGVEQIAVEAGEAGMRLDRWFKVHYPGLGFGHLQKLLRSGQIRVDGKTNEHKAALELLGVLPLRGTVVTGDAMFCHKDVCEKVLGGGGDYLWTVKDNQPQLHFDIAALFAEAAAFSPLPAAPLGV